MEKRHPSIFSGEIEDAEGFHAVRRHRIFTMDDSNECGETRGSLAKPVRSRKRCLQWFSDGTILARRLSPPKHPVICWTLGLQVLERSGGDDETRTRDLCRDSENVDRN